ERHLGLRRRCRRSQLLGVLLLEAVDTAGRVHQLLLAGEEGMALRADLDAQLFLGGAGRPRLAACAVDGNLLILGMDVCFHELTSNRRMLSGVENGAGRGKILGLSIQANRVERAKAGRLKGWKAG